MKNSKKKFILPSLILGATMLVTGGVFAATGGEKAAAEMIATPAYTIASSYEYGDAFVVPACTFEVNGEEKAASATLVYPNGEETKESSILLTQGGTYTVSYFAIVGGKPYVKEYTFEVASRAVEYSGKNTSVEYGAYTAYGSKSNGLLVRLENGDSITFPQVFTMSSLDKNTTIVKGFVTPDVQGIADFSTLLFTFTDVENPDVKLEIQGNFSGNVKAYGLTYFTAAGNGQIHCGKEGNKLQVNNGLGTPVLHSFTAQDTGAYFGAADPTPAVPDSKQFTFAYDDATRQVWAGGEFVSDLDNVDYYSTFWLGFPSGKAKLSVSAKNYAGLTANFCLTEVFGVDLTAQEFSDDAAPAITIDTAYDVMPNAKVGGSYPVPSATAWDEVCGKRDVKVSAWYNYQSASPVLLNVVNGKFATKKAGDYAIVYEAVDYAGNLQKEILWVKAVSEMQPLNAILNNAVSETKIGEWVEIPAPTVSGGSGEYSVKTTVENGETFLVEEGGFRLEKTGEWKVVHTITDYIGNEVVLEYTIEAAKNDAPIFVDLPNMPKVILSDTAYEIPALYINDYSSGSLQRKLCSVEVTDANGTKTYQSGEKFTPKVNEHLDEVTFVYQYGGQKLDPIKIPAAIVWVWEPMFGMSFLHPANYVYGEHISVTEEFSVDGDRGVKIESAADLATNGFRFANAQNAAEFAIVFKTIVGKSSFTGLEVVLTDAANPDISVTVSLDKADGKTRLTLGDTSVLLNANFDAKTSESFEIGLKNGSLVVNGTTSLAIGETDQGQAFSGFPSGKVYFDVNFCNVEEGAAYMLYKVNGTTMTLNSDTIQPSVSITGAYGGNYSYNDIYDFVPAIGCDIYAPNVSITMTVTAPDGSIVKSVDGKKLENVNPAILYQAKLTKYGTYTVAYKVEEEAWQSKNSYVRTYIFNVVDEVAPTISFKGGFQTEAKVGDVLYVPDYTVSDNYSKKEGITVIKTVYNPNGVSIALTGDVNAITCLYEGVYEFRITVIDEAGNSVYVAHKVTVTAK